VNEPVSRVKEPARASHDEPEGGPVSRRTSIVGPREAARIASDAPGPTLIAVGGIHGNEPGGVTAALRVVDRLKGSGARLRGELIVFRGNMGALADRCRYHVRDLNRVWNERVVAALEAKPRAELDPEEIEQTELLGAIRAAIARARGQVYLVDLHTTSAEGVPFAIFGDTLPQRRFVRALPLPLVIGLEEQVDGVLAEYWTRQGCITFTVEGGQHNAPSAVDNLEAAFLLAAEAAGVFEKGALDTADAYALLESRRGKLPRVMEVVERHAITPEDQFEMAPGFRNLDHAKRGQFLARDKDGEIRAHEDGLLILPLYQGQGNDGFFWGRAVSEARLRASERLRTMRLDRLLPLLPGVHRDETHPSRFIVDRRVARLYPLDVFHMFGFRRIRESGDTLTVERQPG
jgi:succinylglutamate desuccinylase